MFIQITLLSFTTYVHPMGTSIYIYNFTEVGYNFSKCGVGQDLLDNPDLIIEIILFICFHKSYFSFRRKRRIPFCAKMNDNNIFCPHNVFKMLMLQQFLNALFVIKLPLDFCNVQRRGNNSYKKFNFKSAIYKGRICSL